MINVMTSLETYKKACEMYYTTGESMMSDAEFDTLQQELKDSRVLGELEDEVEPESKLKKKLKGESGMLSLSKTQVFGDSFEEKHTLEMKSWLDQYSVVDDMTEIELTWKWDGVALRLDYVDGMLKEARTRGNFSLYKKLSSILPHVLDVDYTGQVRCEMIMSKENFKKYENDYQNPRNLVSGIINDDTIGDVRVKDIDLMVLNLDGMTNLGESFDVWGFKNYDHCISSEVRVTKLSYMKDMYQVFLSKRDSLPYMTDGIVVNLVETMDGYRSKGKYPLFARAIKFPPTEQITTVREIIWNLNKLGEWIPVILMDPVDIDGSTVKRTLGFNFGWLVENSCYPGAKVVIAKNGDIIPYIQRVVEKGDYTMFTHPEDVYVDGIHLMTNNSELTDKERFLAGCLTLGIDGMSKKTFEKIGELINWDIIEIFSTFHLDEYKEVLGNAMYNKFISYLENKHSFIPFEVIRMLQFPNCGTVTSDQMARMISGQAYNEAGLEKIIVEKFQDKGEYYNEYMSAVSDLELFGRSVINTTEILDIEYTTTYMMTGSPVKFGWNKKKDFINEHLNWKEVNKIADADILITDDLESNSTKMKKAKEEGVTILDYKQAHEKYGENN